jgi:hypothetical protein
MRLLDADEGEIGDAAFALLRESYANPLARSDLLHRRLVVRQVELIDVIADRGVDPSRRTKAMATGGLRLPSNPRTTMVDVSITPSSPASTQPSQGSKLRSQYERGGR